MRRNDEIEPAHIVGYLGDDNVLYCSPGCAAERGQARAAPVDEGEYPAVLERNGLVPAALCPVCGTEFSPDLDAEER